MPRQKSRRKFQQGIDFVIGYLRSIIEDPRTSPLTRLRAVDRLAKIDNIYEVPLGEAGYLPARAMPQKTEIAAQNEELEDIESDLDRQAREILNKHRTSEEVSDASKLPESGEGTDSSLR